MKRFWAAYGDLIVWFIVLSIEMPIMLYLLAMPALEGLPR